MAKSIHQKASFTASTSAWFNFYLDSKEHAAVFDDRVTISRKVGARFTAFSGMLRGRNLTNVTYWFIVPSWRAIAGRKTTLIPFSFRNSIAKNGGLLTLLQVHIPVHAYRNIKNGWPKHYLVRWNAYLKTLGSF
jgi:hypothetical protein